MERKVVKAIKRQHAVTEAAANQTATKQSKADTRAHEAVLAAHLAQHAMAVTLAAGTATKGAIAAGQTASVATMGEEGSTTIQE